MSSWGHETYNSNKSGGRYFISLKFLLYLIYVLVTIHYGEMIPTVSIQFLFISLHTPLPSSSPLPGHMLPSQDQPIDCSYVLPLFRGISKMPPWQHCLNPFPNITLLSSLLLHLILPTHIKSLPHPCFGGELTR